MPTGRRTPQVLIAVAAAVVFLSRLPFLGNGYGSDADAWRVANAARYIATFGEYQASRLPGYPLQELVCSLLWGWGGRAFAFNLATALLSVLCFVFFSLYLRGLQSRDFILGGLTLVFMPVTFIHSTDSMDYVWALAFILIGIYCLQRDRVVIAGAFLGLAIGCRITSGAMLVPATLMLIHQRGRLEGRHRAKLWLPHFAKLWLPTLLVGLSFYVPTASKYGTSFFTFVEGSSSAAKVIYEASFGVWGAFGSLAIVLSLIWMLIRRPGTAISIQAPKALVLSWLSGLLLYVGAFLRLPHEGGYLVPAIPFTILLLGRFLERRVFVAVCLALIVSSLVVSVEKTGAYPGGPVFRDYQIRKEIESVVAQTIRFGDGSAERRVIVSGWLLPMIQSRLGSDARGQTKYVGLITSSEFWDYRSRGHEIYYLPEMRAYNLQVHQIDLAKEGGKVVELSGGK